MEDLIFLILCLLSIINLRLKGFNNFFVDYMELKNTNNIKGVFVWMIILSHYSRYYETKNKYIYRIILNCIGQKMVSLFLFYSGFGIYESIKSKGIQYIKTLPKKIIILFIKTQIIILIFYFNNLLLGIKTELKEYFLSIIFKSSIGNSNWFAFTILCFYFYSFIFFIFIKEKKIFFIGILFITIINYFHIYFVYNYFYPKKRHTVDNTLCFIIGLYYSLLKKYFEKIIMKNDIFYF
jgi:fucose 4-O-acetylase-like acetyltransferase